MAIQTIFRVLTKAGLFLKCKKGDLICKNNKLYEVTYCVPFTDHSGFWDYNK